MNINQRSSTGNVKLICQYFILSEWLFTVLKVNCQQPKTLNGYLIIFHIKTFLVALQTIIYDLTVFIRGDT